MSLELTGAGIPVLSFACGYDGFARPAVCGAGDGAINIFEIPQDQAELAASLSFLSLSQLSQLTSPGVAPCPS